MGRHVDLLGDVFPHIASHPSLPLEYRHVIESFCGLVPLLPCCAAACLPHLVTRSIINPTPGPLAKENVYDFVRGGLNMYL